MSSTSPGVANYLAYLNSVRLKRVEAVENIVANIRLSQSSVTRVTEVLNLLICEFNSFPPKEDKRRTAFKCQWGWRAPRGGPIGPDGPTFFEYFKDEEGNPKVRRKKHFRERELSRVLGNENSKKARKLISNINYHRKQRDRYISRLNENASILCKCFDIKQNELIYIPKELKIKTKVQSYLKGIPPAFDSIEMLIRRLLERLENIDEQLDKVIFEVNTLTKSRNGAIRLSWKTLSEKHIRNRVTGPAGPYWFTLYFPPGGNRQSYRVNKITKALIRKTYSGRNMSQILDADRKVKLLHTERRVLNAALVDLNRFCKSKYSQTFYEEYSA